MVCGSCEGEESAKKQCEKNPDNAKVREEGGGEDASGAGRRFRGWISDSPLVWGEDYGEVGCLTAACGGPHDGAGRYALKVDVTHEVFLAGNCVPWERPMQEWRKLQPSLPICPELLGCRVKR